DLDPTFGTGGVARIPLGASGVDSVGGLALQPDGKLVIAATADSFATVVRLTQSGDLDPTFAVGGKVSTTDPRAVGAGGAGRAPWVSSSPAVRSASAAAVPRIFRTTSSCAASTKAATSAAESPPTRLRPRKASCQLPQVGQWGQRVRIGSWSSGWRFAAIFL